MTGVGNSLYPRLALQSFRANRQFYVPYLAAVCIMTAAFYNILSIATDPGLFKLRGAEYVSIFAVIGTWITGLFALQFLFYTNRFFMKRRTRELALYHVLGMGKRHIALILLWETGYTALIGIGGGLCLGVLFHKLITLALHRLLRLEIPFGFPLSFYALAATAALFLFILLLTLLHNLRRVRTTNPIALLHSESEGEREPKTRWLLSLLGILSLGGGYALSQLTQTSAEALLVYFLAVIMVILGTYLLFTSVSILVLKLLRKNKGFYYRTSHFIGVSGMLHRMRQNAVGLANICILSTMVLVMVSGTMSLYLGMETVIDTKIPSDLLVTVRYLPEKESGPDTAELLRRVTRYTEQSGLQVESSGHNLYAYCTADLSGDGSFCSDLSGYEYTFSFLTAQDYASAAGIDVPEVAAGQALVWGLADHRDHLTFTDAAGNQMLSLAVQGELPSRAPVSCGFLDTTGRPVQVVVRDAEALLHLYQTLHLRHFCWEMRINVTGTEEQLFALAELMQGEEADYTGTGAWSFLSVESCTQLYTDYFGMAGGFLFLGVFLGTLFLLAAVLIIYYKQISEGYEDRLRFQIMQKVGLTREDIRRSVNSQVLTVFFLPLVVAAVHVAFDLHLMVQLLQLFGITEVFPTILCSLGTLLVFALLYGLVFSRTARAYYRIVS